MDSSKKVTVKNTFKEGGGGGFTRKNISED